MSSKIINIFLLLSLFYCNSTKFTKLQKPKENFALLYVLRSFHPVLSIYEVKIRFFKYKGHFKEKQKEVLQIVSLKTGEFIVFDLEEGFYEILIENNQYSHIFYAEKNLRIFKNITVISKDFFSFSEFYIETLTKEKAVDLLLEGNKMNQKFIQ